MLRNYFKIAFRNLIRNKNYTIINIAGLGAGIAVCLIIFIVIQYETSFDNFHSKKIGFTGYSPNIIMPMLRNIFYGRGVPVPMPAALKTSFPQIEKVATIYTEEKDQILVLNE